MDDAADREVTVWQDTVGSARPLGPRSGSSVATEVQRNLFNLKPANADEIIATVAPCLALVAGVGMHDDARDEWLIAAAEALRGIPTDLLIRGCDAAKLRADHPSKILTTIMDEVGGTWSWRRARKSERLDNRHVEKETATCTAEEAREIARRYKVGSFAEHQPHRNPSQPAAQPAHADPARPCRTPTREDYIRMGIDPAVLDRIAAPTPPETQDIPAELAA